jgi:hypothetical protein
MFVKCIAPFGGHTVGDVTEIPDGSEVSEFWFVPCDASGNVIAVDPASVPSVDPSTPDATAFPPAA